MTRLQAKALTMPILLRIARHMPVKGFLAECGGKRQFFDTMEAARLWIDCQPHYLKENSNEMPSISYGWYTNVIMHIP